MYVLGPDDYKQKPFGINTRWTGKIVVQKNVSLLRKQAPHPSSFYFYLPLSLTLPSHNCVCRPRISISGFLFSFVRNITQQHSTTNVIRKENSVALIHSILFFPSSALKKRAVLMPLSCLATSLPSTLSLRSLFTVSLYPSVAHGRGMSFGQLTCCLSVS